MSCPSLLYSDPFFSSSLERTAESFSSDAEEPSICSARGCMIHMQHEPSVLSTRADARNLGDFHLVHGHRWVCFFFYAIGYVAAARTVVNREAAAGRIASASEQSRRRGRRDRAPVSCCRRGAA
jgi:hypothetical protein